MTTTESNTDPGLRPITRADEARVREVVDALGGMDLRWANDRLVQIDYVFHAFAGAAETGAGKSLARAGIVPGPEGWCWAAAEPAPVPAETPAWLRDAVLAALPVDGTPVSLGRLDAAIDYPPHDYTLDDLREALHWLVKGGEVEQGPDRNGAPTWRRRGAEQPKAEPVAEPTPAPVAEPTRAEQVRHALLAVLTRGPVEGLGNLRALLSAEGLVDVSIMNEARKAAREIGAVIDGARWSLPDVPPGWRWTREGPGFALYLAPVSARYKTAASIANVNARGSGWHVTDPGIDGREIVQGEATDDEHAQRQAVYEARRAGLFAVSAPAAEHEEPAPASERLPDPAGVALSPECAEIDRLAVALYDDLYALERNAPGPKIEAMRGAVSVLAAAAVRHLRARRAAEAERDAIRAAVGDRSPEWAGRYADALDAAGEALIFKGEPYIERLSDLAEQFPHDTPAWVALTAILRTLDTGPAREEHAEPEPEPVDATRWPRAVLARALASLATGDALDKALDAWGASLIAEARCGLTVPHEVVHQHLAERAYAEDALYLFDVYQAAMRWREVRLSGRFDIEAYANALRALDVLLAREPAPREPEPHPHRDVSDDAWETIERIARERDEARLEAEAATARAEKAEADLAALQKAIDDLRTAWAKGRAT